MSKTLTPREKSEKRMTKFCEQNKLKKNEWRKSEEELKLKFGTDPSEADIIWHMFHILLLKNKSKHDKKMLYFEMAKHLFKEKKDHKELLLVVQKLEIEEVFKASKILNEPMTILTEDCCPECESIKNIASKSKDEMENIAKKLITICTRQKNEHGGWCICLPNTK